MLGPADVNSVIKAHPANYEMAVVNPSKLLKIMVESLFLLLSSIKNGL
jgi:acyl-coenzyme A synthetase/AMP-(fatty) acid ligase